MADSITAGIGAAIAAAGFALALAQHRRSQYERAERLVDYATTGEIAEARHTLGREAWIRDASLLQPELGAVANGDQLTKALFHVAWAMDRIFTVRSSVSRMGLWRRHSDPDTSRVRSPQTIIDDVLKSWVLWWGEDVGSGCRYGRVAHTLQALEPAEHKHLARLVSAMGKKSCGLEEHRPA